MGDHDRRKYICVSAAQNSQLRRVATTDVCISCGNARGGEMVAENVTSGRPPAITSTERKRRRR
jgi:hypothetical protein